MEPKKSKTLKNTIFVLVVVVVLALVGLGTWYTLPHSSAPKFCYTFTHNMQFGDRTVANPFNIGYIAPDKNVYYLPEVPNLQTALVKQGFYVDPFEQTGGKVYAAAFYGPTTRAAVMSFQKKYALPQTGQVTNDTIDKLAALYACPTSTAATTTSAYTVSTTTPGK